MSKQLLDGAGTLLVTAIVLKTTKNLIKNDSMNEKNIFYFFYGIQGKK